MLRAKVFLAVEDPALQSILCLQGRAVPGSGHSDPARDRALLDFWRCPHICGHSGKLYSCRTEMKHHLRPCLSNFQCLPILMSRLGFCPLQMGLHPDVHVHWRDGTILYVWHYTLDSATPQCQLWKDFCIFLNVSVGKICQFGMEIWDTNLINK